MMEGLSVEKRRKAILIIAMIVFLLAIGIGIFAAISESGSESSSSGGTSSSAFAGSFLPLITVFIVFMQPTSPVNNTIYVLTNKKYNQDQRAKYIENYISKYFRSSEKYEDMVKEQWPKNKKSEVKEKGPEKSIIILELVNGDKYEFEVVKRTKENSQKQASMWIINDYTRL